MRWSRVGTLTPSFARRRDTRLARARGYNAGFTGGRRQRQGLDPVSSHGVLTGMRFVSFLVFVTRAGRSEQAAFATRHRLAPDRSLTLTTQFWAQDTDEHTLHVVDEPAEGGPRVIATCTAAATVANALLHVDLSVPALTMPGAHHLHLEVDGERVMSSPIDVTVRDVPRRGRRSRYKGRAR
jgi:hypothetical protein